MSTDPVKNFGNVKEFYELLRSVNPHLPDGEHVAREELTITLGFDQIAAVNMTVFITLPDKEKLIAAEREMYPTLTVDELMAAAREYQGSSDD